MLRLLGFGMGCLPLMLLMREEQMSPWFIAAVVGVCLVWPHVAFKRARRAANPLACERWNMIADAAWGGWLVSAVHFEPVATLVVLMMFGIDNMSVGGWRLFGAGAAASCVGLAIGVAVFGATPAPAADASIVVTWLPVIVVYPLVLAKTTHDVSTKLIVRSRRLRELSERDSLTGLANRATIGDKLEGVLEWARHAHRDVAVLFIDLDGFKTINDALGHNIGDVLLIEVAERLMNCAGPSDIVARYGGDEFVMVARERHVNAHSLPEAVLTALAQPVYAAGHELVIGASIGVSMFPTDGTDAPTLLRAADIAMYTAKNRGRNCHAFYRPSMRVAADARLKLSARLRKAIESGKLHLHYQPQVDMRSGQVRALEALVRWYDEEYGDVSPVDFVSVAEASGFVSALGEWVLRAACEQAAKWRAQGLAPMPISINLSPVQLQRTNIVTTFQRVLHETGMAPTLLELEVTETALMKNPEAAVRQLDEFRRCGVRVAIDDFGVGYSSLGQLSALPVDRIKIDRAFVRGIGHGDTGAIATAIVTLANTLGLAVIAEGVETITQQDFLLSLGCVDAQGYLYSEPLDPDAATRLLEQGAVLSRRQAPSSPQRIAL
ncbi:EAL domain-containing protein [Trinickia fusca]|uniref:EAL domain-containing protein n=1 Tax=Trinickia fusca TaxID=2419777 RepID=A0A494X704_9BURK|nr:EAL domain-containing protein [Trinickia fusca]